MIIVTSYNVFRDKLKVHNITDENVNMSNKFYICINDITMPDEIPDQPYFKLDHNNVLRLWFDDVTEDTIVPIIGMSEPHVCKAMTEYQGVIIVEFLHRMFESGIEDGIIHCRAGISRSGAVGEFASDIFGVPYTTFRQYNPHCLPNPHVLSTLKRINRTYQ